MQLHTLKSNTFHKRKKRVGRGGKRGKTSGRGTKGQKARAGHRIRPAIRDTIKKLPKKRGTGKHRARSVNAERVRPIVVNLSVLERVYESGEKVTPQTLHKKGGIRGRKNANVPVKILGMGEITKKLTVTQCLVSKSAKEKIEKAGGVVRT